MPFTHLFNHCASPFHLNRKKHIIALIFFFIYYFMYIYIKILLFCYFNLERLRLHPSMLVKNDIINVLHANKALQLPLT